MTSDTKSPASSPSLFSLSIPGDVDYIPPARKFVYETILSYGFSSKFAYRSEVVVDEVCNNAVMYGCSHIEAEVNITLSVYTDYIEIEVSDSGGNVEDKRRLSQAAKQTTANGNESINENTLGLEMVKLLSSEMHVAVGENNTTSIRVVRRRNNNEN